jgi:glycosyltransferase involved in cell wall biosynthesis|tara:strand:- start:1271 stop:2275 length:1005 start_codon:yes stop_codon:yes gene_type:complete
MKKKIIIIDNSNLAYSGEEINGVTLRGTETSLILLAEQFVKMNIEVHFCNNILKTKIVNGVKYFNKKKIDKSDLYNLAIAVSDAKQFDNVSALKKAVFSNSNQPFEKFLRKKQLIPFLKHKPVLVTLCNYQYHKRSFLTSFYGKKMIPITVDPKFLNIDIDLEYLPKKKVVYNIRSNRNLDWLLDIWCKKIFPFNKDFELYITPNIINYSDKLKAQNVFLRKIGSRSDMIEELKEYRALTYLGHKSDIFTLTCEESVKLCLPLITFGIGSISDRVLHNETGFLVKNDQEFADYTIKLLNNDNFYLDLRKKMHQIRHKNNWVDIANLWVENFLSE